MDLIIHDLQAAHGDGEMIFYRDEGFGINNAGFSGGCTLADLRLMRK